jgi:hypothetical protein
MDDLQDRTGDQVRYEEMLSKAIRNRYGTYNPNPYYRELTANSGEQNPQILVQRADPQMDDSLGTYQHHSGIRMNKDLIAKEAQSFGIDPRSAELSTIVHEIEHARDMDRGFTPKTDERMFLNPGIIDKHFMHDRVGEQVPAEGRRALWVMLKDLRDASQGPNIPLE